MECGARRLGNIASTVVAVFAILDPSRPHTATARRQHLRRTRSRRTAGVSQLYRCDQRETESIVPRFVVVQLALGSEK